MAERFNGKITNTLADKGYGFINRNIFFHKSELPENVAIEQLNVGDNVSFFTKAGRKPNSVEAYAISLEKTTTKLPYVHVPLQENKSVLGKPVPHNSTDKTLISGTLSLKLEVLTPLLMANYQFTYDQLPQYYQDLLPKDFKELMSSEQNNSARQKKKFLIPNYVEITTGTNQAPQKELLLVLPGKSIRNVLRRSLIALCQAPFERVAERDYTRVPNLQANGAKTRNQAAFITAIDSNTVTVKLVNKVHFLSEDATKFFEDTNEVPDEFGKVFEAPTGYRIQQDRHKLKIFKGNERLLGKWVPALYNGGSDGIGELATAHNDGKKAFVHSVVFLPADELKSPLIDIDSAVYERYQEEQKFLANRIDTHPLRAKLGDAKSKGIKEKIEEFQTLKVGQLIYVELDEASNQIIRIGRHYYYKTRTKHSLKRVNNQLRKVFEPNSAEMTVKDQTQMPSLLTAARLLMGYVRDDDTQHIAAGPWQYYKGRIAIVDAVAQEKVTREEFPSKEGTNVFSWLQLNVALGPKGSPVRMLEQSNGLVSFEHANTTLSGYPFFRHVSAASVDAQLQTLQQEEFYKNDLAPIGFDVCHTGTFKTTVTFSKLHDWELGALLCLLEPRHLLTAGRDLGKDTQFAHKFGRGKSIGMGSTAMKVTSIKQLIDTFDEQCFTLPHLKDIEQDVQATYIEAFKTKLAEQNIECEPWLAVHLLDHNDNAQLRYPAITSYQAWNKALASKQRGIALNNEAVITKPFITKATKQEQ